tara:strand:+ start:354 stop:1097 length:744 start_codon:yes stop_codon:yes gene_type:complete
MTNLKGVFWDIDGTIADTEIQGHRIAFNKSFKASNIDWIWDESSYKNLLSIGGGKNRIQAYANSNNEQLSSEDVDYIHKLKTQFYHEILLSGKIKLRIGVRRLVEELQQNNIKQWIVTTSSLKAAQPLLLNHFKGDSFPFDGLISSNDVHNVKPHPQAYLIALKRSKLNSNNVISIEDSLIGLRSATSANIRCLVTLTKWSNYRMKDLESSIAIVDSLGDLGNSTNIRKGPQCSRGLVDYDYLSQLL